MKIETLQAKVSDGRPWRVRCRIEGKWVFATPLSIYRTKPSNRWVIAYETHGCIVVDQRLPIDPLDMTRCGFPFNDAMMIAALLNMLFGHQDFNEALAEELNLSRKDPPPEPLLEIEGGEKVEDTPAEPPVHPGAQGEVVENENPNKQEG